MFQHKFDETFATETEAMVSFAEIVSAFSYALDLTQGQPKGHCIRCCWIGTHIGEALGLGKEQLWELYYTLLLKDLGCSSNAARICELYLADDHAIKRDYKLIDGKMHNVLRFVLARTGTDASLGERIGALGNVLKNGSKIERDIIETRCVRGADIARQLRFPEAVAEGIAGLDEHWDGSGLPNGIEGEAIPLYSRIALLSQVIDIFRMANGEEAACQEIRKRSGGWFDPDLCDAFGTVAEDPAFWAALEARDIERRVIALEPTQHMVIVDEDFLDDIAAAFGQVIDAKSPFTSGHSGRVAVYAAGVAERLGYDAPYVRKLSRAAALHDIGKLGISNLILDKPGKLTDEEWRVMRSHTHYTTAILGRISVFHDMAAMAGAHHERLDGKGYPHSLCADTIHMDTRIITICDYFDALTADRPYRAAMSVDKALDIIGAEVGGAIDASCFEALKAMVAEQGPAT
ncbi:MAG: HD domain-containing phosphohydrolase [Pseudomonadota bacterium]